MGYRSDVVIAVAMGSKEDMDELVSVYALNIFVQKENLIPEWEIGEYEDAWVAMYKESDCGGQDDVQGSRLADTLADALYISRQINNEVEFANDNDSRNSVNNERTD